MRFKLKTTLLAALVLLLLPVLIANRWVTYRTVVDSAKDFEKQLTSEVAERAFDRIDNFFRVTARVVQFNLDQGRNGFLQWDDRNQLIRNFAIQLNRHPFLNAISLGTVEGEFFASNRPPWGADRSLRDLRAEISQGRFMHLYRYDEANPKSQLLSKTAHPYDARQRPWYQAALAAGKTVWYPVYRYQVQDDTTTYEDLGIGAAAPLYDQAGRLIGVTAADLALSQLSVMLGEATANTGGIAFLAEATGELVALSTQEPIFHLDANSYRRFKGESHANPVVRALALAVKSNPGQGKGEIEVEGMPYLLEWRRVQLPQGPVFTMAVAVPESHFGSPAQAALQGVFNSTLIVLAFALLATLLASQWVVRPLVALVQWSTNLAKGDWHGMEIQPGPIQEVNALSHALEQMAQDLRKRQVELERQVAERTAELRKANAAKDKFFSIIAHDLRGPVGSLALIFNELLTKGQALDDDLFESIQKSTKNTYQLLEDLLSWSRSQRGEIAFHPETFEIALVIQSIFELLGNQAQQKSIALAHQGDAGVAVFADPVMTTTVLRNLVGNAIKFTPEGGRIEVVVTAVPGQTRIEVRDSGLGIPPERQARLFKLGEKVESTPGTRSESGTGLGLILCAEFVGKQGGQIGVESTPGQGSRFWFTLPVGLEAAPLEEWSEAALRQRLAGMRVLVAEDNPLHQETTLAVLRECGCRFSLAENGQVAVELAQAQGFDMVLMDIDMPVLNGIAAAEQIRRLAQPPAWQVALSAYSQQELEQIPGGEFFAGYLNKPLTPPELLRLLKRLFSASGASPLDEAPTQG